MKSRLFCALIAAVLCPLLSATTTVAGSIKTLGTTVAKGSYIRFWLRGCKGNQPRVSGVAIFPANVNGQFYFDVPTDAAGTVAGTIYSTRAANGIDGGEIDCGGSRVATWYGMQVFRNSVGGPEVPVHAKDTGMLDVSNVTPISTSSVVVAGTGDNTYLRLDGGNSPITGTLSVNAPFFVNGATQLSTTTISNATVTNSLGLSNSGVFTNSQMNEYVTSQIGPQSAGSLYSSTQGGNFATDALSGIVTAPVGATAHQFNGVNGNCVTNALSSPLGASANCVALYGDTRINANNTAGWGQNVVVDLASGTTGTLAIGTEVDMNMPAGTAPNRFQGYFITGIPLTGTMPTGPTMGTIPGSSNAAFGYGASFPANSTTQFPVMYYSSRGSAAVGLMLDAACYAGACNSQVIQLGANSGTTAKIATIQADQIGDVTIGSNVVGAGVQFPTAPFASLNPSGLNGTILYCTDCKNVVDNSATAGAACLGSGSGAFARRQNNRWDCN